MKHIVIGVLALLLVGCGNRQVQTTPPLADVKPIEVKVPVATCPAQMEQIKYPSRPALPIDDLTIEDKQNFDKVGKAYMQTVALLKKYSEDLEDAAYGARDICRSVNTTISGK